MSAAAASPVADLLACPACGALQSRPQGPARPAGLACPTCRTEIENSRGRSLDAALACAGATLLLLAPANLLPVLTTSILDVSRHSWLISTGQVMWTDGWPWLALAIGLFVVVSPILRFSLLTTVLGAVRLGRHPPWLGRAFRHANALQTWAMLDVFVLGLWVAYARLAATVSVRLEAGGVCVVLAGLLSLFSRATLDKAAVWQAIRPQPLERIAGPVVSCPGCELVLPVSQVDHRCPRCEAVVRARAPEALGRAAALTLAGALLYLPANLLPLATVPIDLKPTRYTVLEGIKDLAQAHLFGLAALVFCASFAIPLLKLGGLSWCIASVLRRSRRRLVLKTRLYRVIDEIGRWSMVDPFVIGAFVPVMRYNTLVYGRAEPGATAFAGVVVLTVIAARCFDPRLLWDAAEEGA